MDVMAASRLPLSFFGQVQERMISRRLRCCSPRLSEAKKRRRENGEQIVFEG